MENEFDRWRKVAEFDGPMIGCTMLVRGRSAMSRSSSHDIAAVFPVIFPVNNPQSSYFQATVWHDEMDDDHR